MAASRGTRVELPEDMAAELSAPGPAARREEPTADELRAIVAEHGGNLVRASKALGLPSRYALYRLLRKHGIDADDFRATGD
jgi:transcriptional regulator of acetoin/glycerol metabolism